MFRMSHIVRTVLVFLLAAVWQNLLVSAEPACGPPGVGPSEVLFGYGVTTGRAYDIVPYKDLASQGKFFSTADYVFAPGQKYQYTGDHFGIKGGGDLYIRGRDIVSSSRFFKSNDAWLSDGGECIFGVIFDKPFKQVWAKRPYLTKQFAPFENETPRFDQAVIYWGEHVPRKGSWSACLLDAKGDLKRIKVDNQQQLYPLDMTTLNFPPTTVNAIYFGLLGGENGLKDNFTQVRRISLNLANPKLIDNRLAVFQMDAYSAGYSTDMPGMIDYLFAQNAYFGERMMTDARPENSFLSFLSPFIEENGKRRYAVKGRYPVDVETNGRDKTLKYCLEFPVSGTKTIKVKTTAIFGVALENTVKFVFEADALLEKTRLGFEMTSSADLFANYLDLGETVMINVENQKRFNTPAGPFGIALTGVDNVILNRSRKGADTVRFDIFAEKNELEVALSLPIGPNAGIQPGMLSYQWYPSLTNQGDPGLMPFKAEDLELLESVNLGDPRDSHECYDISNDPIILNWRKSGAARAPREFGRLNFLNDPDKGKVPLTPVLGKMCRVINSKDSTYFRFNLKTRFYPWSAYLFVVEHAFDRERRGEFHVIGLDQSGLKLRSLSGNQIFGCFDTGKPPLAGRFETESVFSLTQGKGDYADVGTFSLCFSNSFGWTQHSNEQPEGLAIKSVRIYRVKNMPGLPDQQALAPKGPRRHLSFSVESTTPWAFSEYPKLAGFNTAWNHTKPTSHFLSGGGITKYVPGVGTSSWHAGTLDSQRWLFEKAETQGMFVNISCSSLVELGFEGTGRRSFIGDGNITSGVGRASFPLSPTKQELDHLARALNRSLDVLSPYRSFRDVSISNSALSFFSKRNMDDFSRETGISFASGPAWIHNFTTMIESDRKTIDAWITWSCRKRFEYLTWLVNLVKSHRSDLHVTLNYCAHKNAYQWAYFGNEGQTGPIGSFDRNSPKLKAIGINTYYDFLKLICTDPGLYQGKSGFSFAIEEERTTTWQGKVHFPSFYHEKWFGKLKDSFEDGISVASSNFEESSKPLVSWTCIYVKDQRTFRQEIIDALLYANAREFNSQTYLYDPFLGRLMDVRTLSVAFQLLPFAKPKPFEGTLNDPSSQAVINKYENRYGLINPNDKETTITLTLPEGVGKLYDLSNGVRQRILTTKTKSGEYQATLHLEPWSLRTLEMK